MELRSNFKNTKDFKKYLSQLELDIKYNKTVSELYKYSGDDEATIEFQELIIDYNGRVESLKSLLPDISRIDNNLQVPKNPVWMLIISIWFYFSIMFIPIGIYFHVKYNKANKIYKEDQESGNAFISSNEDIRNLLQNVHNLVGDGTEFAFGWSDFAQEISDEINSGSSSNFVQARIQVQKNREEKRLREAEISAMREEAESKKKLSDSIKRLGK